MTGDALGLQPPDDRQDAGGEPVGLVPQHLGADRRALLRIGAAQLRAACLGGVQGGLGALADHLARVLGHGGEDVDGEPVGLRHVHGDKFHAGLHQPADKMDVARQPVELGDQQRGFMFPAGIERGGELWAVVLPAALDLGKALDYEFPVAAQGDTDGLLLGFQSKAAAALAGGRDAKIGDIAACFHGRKIAGTAGIINHKPTDTVGEPISTFLSRRFYTEIFTLL